MLLKRREKFCKKKESSCKKKQKTLTMCQWILNGDAGNVAKSTSSKKSVKSAIYNCQTTQALISIKS